MQRFDCPVCGKRLKAMPARSGGRVRCPRCRTRIVLPGAEPEQALDFEPHMEAREPEPVETSGAPEPDEPTDDFVPLRKRKRPRASALGLLLVGGLGLLILVALGGIAWKISASGHQADHRIDQARRAKAPAERKSESSVQPVPRNGTQSTDGDAPSLTPCIVIVVIVFGIVGFILLVILGSRCPECERYFAGERLIRTEVIDVRRCYGLVKRTANTSGTSFNWEKPSGTTESYSTTTYVERVPIVRTTTRRTYKCMYCPRTWSEDEIAEVEDFERP
ncbi:unnamed protein product [Gemmata massiliana]|uniref:Uncharacterized protein n=1 Tax=Gemmata massiliana TaxID=1210884 RepID=A0A6P2D3Y9_9BACT|nr:unnamed protein product [Gemmata massiliana]